MDPANIHLFGNLPSLARHSSRESIAVKCLVLLYDSLEGLWQVLLRDFLMMPFSDTVAD